MFSPRVLARYVVATFLAMTVAGFASGGEEAGKKSPAAHRTLDCSCCHQVVASLGKIEPGPSPIQQCRTCHDQSILANTPVAGAFHKESGRACSDCHSFHQTSHITAGRNEFTLSNSSGRALCAACHSGVGSLALLSPGHIAAAKLYHSNSGLLAGLDASAACLICHGESRRIEVDGVSLSEVPQFSEQHTHPIGEITRRLHGGREISIREFFDPRLPVYDNRIECQTCHQLTANNHYRLAEFDSPQALCNGCHTLN